MTQQTIAQKVRMMLESRDKLVIRQAVELVTSLDLKKNKLRKDFVSTFAHCFSDEDINACDYRDIKSARKKNETENGKGKTRLKLNKTKHNLHSLCHSELLWSELWDNYCLDHLFYFTTNAAWLLSYSCGLWEHWHKLDQDFPINIHEYKMGELASSPLLTKLKDLHIHILSPLDPHVLEMIKRLKEVGVASIKLDSLCDEYFPNLLNLGEDVLILLKNAAKRAVQKTQSPIERNEPVYLRWISKVLKQNKVKGPLVDRWKFVLQRASLAKTIKIKAGEHSYYETHLKMVYCPVTIETSKGLWVSRTLYSDDLNDRREYDDEPRYVHYQAEAEQIQSEHLAEYFNGWNRTKRYKLPYPINENNDELIYDKIDLSKRSLRLPSLEELILIAQAENSKQAYSGSSCKLHLKYLDHDFNDRSVALHAPNDWGLYDVASQEEYVWSEDQETPRVYDELFDEYIFIYGDTDSLAIQEKAASLDRKQPAYWLPVKSAIRIVLPA